jgi:hypothetical protein
MVILTSAWPRSEDPTGPTFWFRMSIASIVGGLLAFPVNWWLVKNHLKHGCMTLPGRDAPAPGLGHHSPEPGTTMQPLAGSQSGMAMPAHHAQRGESHEGHGMTMRELPFAVEAAWVLATFALLALAVVVTDRFVPVRFH